MQKQSGLQLCGSSGPALRTTDFWRILLLLHQWEKMLNRELWVHVESTQAVVEALISNSSISADTCNIPDTHWTSRGISSSDQVRYPEWNKRLSSSSGNVVWSGCAVLLAASWAPSSFVSSFRICVDFFPLHAHELISMQYAAHLDNELFHSTLWQQRQI